MDRVGYPHSLSGASHFCENPFWWVYDMLAFLFADSNISAPQLFCGSVSSRKELCFEPTASRLQSERSSADLSAHQFALAEIF